MIPLAGKASDRTGPRSQLRQYCEALCVIAALTAVASIAPVGYRAVSLIHLLCLVAMSLRLDRRPVLVATVVSPLGWDGDSDPGGLGLGLSIVQGFVAPPRAARWRPKIEPAAAQNSRSTCRCFPGRRCRTIKTSVFCPARLPI